MTSATNHHRPPVVWFEHNQLDKDTFKEMFDPVWVQWSNFFGMVSWDPLVNPGSESSPKALSI
jgi:hypothetical protein